MKFYSTRNKKESVSFSHAVLKGLAHDGGLFVPEHFPSFDEAWFQSLSSRSLPDIAFDMVKPFVSDEISDSELRHMVATVFNFDVHLAPVKRNIFSLELYHGPTLAFKDFGARFMAQMLQHFSKKIDKQIVVLAATSGDTGSAVANGFLGVDAIHVIVLYPKGKVSELQEKQFATLGKNITALEVDGVFDDCQQLVKTTFQDDALNKKYFLTSANSINIARLIPQMLYYFYGWSRLPKNGKTVVSVPSGNFGNLTAGLWAKKIGLPIHRFVASTNSNDVVPAYLANGKFLPKPSQPTMSNAMDVGNPSNFERILDLYQHDWEKIRTHISGEVVSEIETENTLRKTNDEGYLLDPHGAVGLAGLQRNLQADETGLFLETAHPAKFKNVVDAILKTDIAIPPALEKFLRQPKLSLPMSSHFNDFKTWLLNR